MKNWKTTLLGVATILGALSTAAISYAKTGTCEYGATVTAVLAGWGLIHAKDGSNVTTVANIQQS